jgi:hypothetical protein
VTVVAPALDNLTVNVTEETLVRASLDATFAALLEELGPSNGGHNDTPMPMLLEPWPGGRWFRGPRGRQWASLGTRAGDQTAHAARDHRAADDVHGELLNPPPFLGFHNATIAPCATWSSSSSTC